MSDFLLIDGELLHFIFLLYDLSHRARLDNHPILIIPTTILVSLQVPIGFRFLLVEYLIDYMRLCRS